MIDYKPLYTVVEAAKILKIAPDTVRNELIATRRLRAVRLYDKSALKIRGKDLEDFINGITPIEPDVQTDVSPEVIDKLYAVV